MSFLYWEEEVKYNYKYSQEQFSQELKLGYKGNIYTPRLLDYTIEGTIRFEELKSRNLSSSSTQKSDSQDYKVKLKFIQSTRFPFDIYANKSERPVSIVNNSLSEHYTYRSENSGINGRMKFDLFSINYGLTDSSTLSDSSYYLEDRKIGNYYTSIRHTQESSNLEFKYSYQDEKIERKTYAALSEYISKTDQLVESVSMFYRWKISKELRLNANAIYREADYSTLLSKSTNVNVNLNWRPTSKLNASLSTNGARFDSVYNANNIEGASSRLDSYSINQSITYAITPTLSLTESASQYVYENETTSGDATNVFLGLRHNYNKIYSEETSLRVFTSLDGQIIDSENLSKVDNIKTSTSTQRYTISIKAGVTEQFPSIASKMGLSVNYSDMRTSTDEYSQRYGSNLSFSSNFTSSFSNSMSAGILKYTRQYSRYDTDSNSYYLTEDITTTTHAMDTLNFLLRLGSSSNLKFKAGIRYSKTENSYDTVERVQPLANLSFKYRFGRNLLYSANAQADADLIYNNTRYNATSLLKYQIGKTAFLVSYRYTKTEYEVESTDATQTTSYNSERNRLDVRLTRKF